MSRLSPQRLAKLANALGVSTPLPVCSLSPSPSIATSNSFLLHVIPPSQLADLNAPAGHNHFLRGILVPLHSTLHAQLAAIAREYALPSTAGLVLYLISESDQPDGPRLSDDIWKLLWSRVVSVERSPSPSPSPLRPLTCSPSPSTPSSIRSAFNSLHSDPPTPDTSVDTHPAPPDLLLPGLTSPSLLPILAKVEFDIDKRKATWYNPWVNSRLNKLSNAPRELLTVKRSEMLKKDPFGLNNPPPPINHDEDDDEELDEDATATFPTHTNMSSDDNQGFSTKEEEVLKMLEIMSVRSKSRSGSSTSSSTHSSLARKIVLPPLLINPDTHNDRDMEQSYLAYTEPLPPPLPERDESLGIITNKEGQGGKREFAVFDDLELEFDHTLDFDEDDPNDRRKSQFIMRAKLDEIERTMAQLSPRMLHSDLSLSPDRSSLRVSPTSPKGLEFLSPRTQSDDNSRSFITSSPPRLPRPDEYETEDKSWPAIPFSVIKESQPENTNSNAPPPPPRLALNGVSTVPRAFVAAPTRPPPPPPLTGSIISNGMSVPLTETEKRRREVEEQQGVYEVTLGRDLTLQKGGGVIPLSPDPFGRYPSSSPTEPPPDITGEVPETRARSGTVTTTTTTTKSRFSADSHELIPAPPPASGGLKPTSNRATLMSVKTIKKLWRRSKEKEKSGGDAPPPTPVTPTFANPASSAGSSNDIDKSLPSIPPPRPSRPSEEQLDFPDISMQAALPPRLTPSPTPRLSTRPLMHGGDSIQNVVNGNGRRTPLGQELVPTGRKTPQEQLVVPPPSRPSLDQLTAPSPPPALTQAPPPQPGTGRRTPQDQLMFRPPSRPSLDQSATPPPPALTPPQQQIVHQQRPLGSGRRTPQDQLPFRPPSRPALDQQPSVAVLPTSNHLHSQPHVPPPHPSHFRHPSQQQQQPAMQMPMFQGRNANNGPVKPLLAMHYPSRSTSVSQQQKFDMNRLLFDQESPYPVRLASFAGGGTPAGAATVTSTTKAATAGYVSGGPGVGLNPRASPPPPPQPQRPPSVEPEKPTAITTMRKSILKWKLANPNANVNTNPYGNLNNQGFSDTSSSSSSSSTSSSIVGGAVPRQSLERFERPGAAGSNGGYGHHSARGGSGRRPSVINFGSTSSLSSSTSVSSNNRGGAEIPRNPQVPAQYTMMRSASSSSSSGGESKPNHASHVHIMPTTNPPPSLTIQNPNDLQPIPSPQSLSPSRQSFDSQSPGSTVERRSNASSFDMTQFEFVSPIPASAPVLGSLRT